MIRLRPFFAMLLLLALLPLDPRTAEAAPLRFGGDAALDGRAAGDAPRGAGIARDWRPVVHVRLLMSEVLLLPSGRVILRPAPGPRPEPAAGDLRAAPVILPLPGAFPLLAGALGGLVLLGWRGRHPRALAAREG